MTCIGRNSKGMLLIVTWGAFHAMSPDFYRQCSDEAVLYYSPKAQASLHAKHPNAWPAAPRWDFGKLEEVFVAGAEVDDIRWFKYKAGA